MNPQLLEKLEQLPAIEKLSPAYQSGKRICRPQCRCCGGAEGIRKAFRRVDNSKPKYKKHRVMKLREAEK